MKKIVLGVVLMLAASSANAAWCRAQSPFAWGEGTAQTIAQACQIALFNCAKLTPYGSMCLVVNVVY